MSLLSRLKLFASLTGQSILGNDMDDEFNQLYDVLSGNRTDKRIVIVYSNSSNAPLVINQLGLGDIFKAKIDNVDAVTINNSGQIVSSVLTGTAPIVTDSQTKVVNLNADLVNGIEGNKLVRNDISGQSILGNLRFKKASSGDYDFLIEVDNDTVTFYRAKFDNDNALVSRTAIFSIANLNSTTKNITLDSNIRLQVGYTPTSDTDVVRRLDLTNRLTVLAVPGLIPTPGTTTRCCFFVAPAKCVITKAKYGYVNGTPSGDLTLSFAGQSFTLLSVATALQVYEKVFSPAVTLNEADQGVVSTGSNSGHSNVFVELLGYYTND